LSSNSTTYTIKLIIRNNWLDKFSQEKQNMWIRFRNYNTWVQFRTKITYLIIWVRFQINKTKITHLTSYHWASRAHAHARGCPHACGSHSAHAGTPRFD
jgi:hypothetical protein